MAEVELSPVVPTAPVTKATAEHLRKFDRKKCSRCFRFFTPEEEQLNGCWYHPGKYWEPNSGIMQGANIGWSCCRVKEHVGFGLSDINQESLSLMSKGCVHAANHLEDVEFSARLSQFPLEVDSIPVDVLAPTPEAETKEEKNEPAKKVVYDPEKYHLLHVTEVDTLVGISLKYNVPISRLQRINRLGNSHQIFHLSTLLVPKTADNKAPPPRPHEAAAIRKEALKSFQRRTGVTAEEARFYMEEHDYHLEKALKEYEEETKWEQSLGNKKHSSNQGYSVAMNPAPAVIQADEDDNRCCFRK